MRPQDHLQGGKSWPATNFLKQIHAEIFYAIFQIIYSPDFILMLQNNVE